MKRFSMIIGVSMLTMLTGCIKNEIATFGEAQIEWDASTWNANTVGVTYPIMARVPIYGFATPTSSPAITRTTGNVRLRINLIGAQAAIDRTFAIKFNQNESSATQGTHFALSSTVGTIKANESFGYIDVQILNPGASTGSKTVVLELVETPDFKPSVNYAKVGLSISQT